MTLPTSGLITINDRGARAATTFGSVEAGGGNMVFIKKLTASDSGTLSFVDGASSVVLDNTYKEYLFTFKDIHPATDQKKLRVNFRDGDSDYDATKTTTVFQSYHAEDDSSAGLAYEDGQDLAQSTAAQNLSPSISNDNDASCSGYLHLFNPSSTTFVKHFFGRFSGTSSGDFERDDFPAGYFNTTSAIDEISFKFNSGNIDSGTFKLYGIKDS